MAQQRGVEFAVEPGRGSETDGTGGYFLIRADPGQRVRQSVTVRNESARSIELQLTAVDATTGQLGGVSYGLPDDVVASTGAWINLDADEVRLRPGEQRSVAFDVTVPEEVGGGEHVAGIAVWEARENGGDGNGGEPVSVAVQTRRVIAVQIDLPGPKVPELVVTGVEPVARPDGLYLEIGIENEGSAMTTGEGTLEIRDEAFFRDFSVDTFVPGTAIGYPLKWTDEPREGTYEARVELEYDGGVAEWSGMFTVGDPLLADLEDRGVDVPETFPIFAAAAAVAGAIAAGAAWWTLRRRRRDLAPPPAPGSSAGRTKPSSREVSSSARVGPPPPPPPKREE